MLYKTLKQYYKQTKCVPKPFLKWVGGKRQIITCLQRKLCKNISTYFEPFLGGGAMFFNLAKFQHVDFYLSDLNFELILSYVVIRDKVKEVIESLKNHSYEYFMDPRNYYYHVRNSNPKNHVDITSRLIFLNKTCFNGLYRVNKKGKFNVPLGKYSKPNIVNEDNLLMVSNILQSEMVILSCMDFSAICSKVQKDDFVYLDPPYYPTNNTSNFTSYTNKNFKLVDFYRFVTLSEKLHDLGCKVMISNSNTKFILDSFSSRHWKIFNVEANRTINSKSQSRKNYVELIITNY